MSNSPILISTKDISNFPSTKYTLQNNLSSNPYHLSSKPTLQNTTSSTSNLLLLNSTGRNGTTNIRVHFTDILNNAGIKESRYQNTLPPLPNLTGYSSSIHSTSNGSSTLTSLSSSIKKGIRSCQNLSASSLELLETEAVNFDYEMVIRQSVNVTDVVLEMEESIMNYVADSLLNCENQRLLASTNQTSTSGLNNEIFLSSYPEDKIQRYSCRGQTCVLFVSCFITNGFCETCKDPSEDVYRLVNEGMENGAYLNDDILQTSSLQLNYIENNRGFSKPPLVSPTQILFISALIFIFFFSISIIFILKQKILIYHHLY